MADTKTVEGPASYNALRPPTSAELKAPTKVYPGASKLPSTPSGKTVEGPGCNNYMSK